MRNRQHLASVGRGEPRREPEAPSAPLSSGSVAAEPSRDPVFVVVAELLDEIADRVDELAATSQKLAAILREDAELVRDHG